MISCRQCLCRIFIFGVLAQQREFVHQHHHHNNINVTVNITIYRCDSASTNNPCISKDSKATCTDIAGGGYKCTCSSMQYSGKNCDKSWCDKNPTRTPNHTLTQLSRAHHALIYLLTTRLGPPMFLGAGAIPTAPTTRASRKTPRLNAQILPGAVTNALARAISTRGKIARRAGALLANRKN